MNPDQESVGLEVNIGVKVEGGKRYQTEDGFAGDGASLDKFVEAHNGVVMSTAIRGIVERSRELKVGIPTEGVVNPAGWGLTAE